MEDNILVLEAKQSNYEELRGIFFTVRQKTFHWIEPEKLKLSDFDESMRGFWIYQERIGLYMRSLLLVQNSNIRRILMYLDIKLLYFIIMIYSILISVYIVLTLKRKKILSVIRDKINTNNELVGKNNTYA